MRFSQAVIFLYFPTRTHINECPKLETCLSQEMELTTCHSRFFAKLPKPLKYRDLGPRSALPSADVFGFNLLPRKSLHIFTEGRQRAFGTVYASRAETSSADNIQNWLLEPIGDGNTKHIGFKTQMPGAFEIVSRTVTVGRVPEKADIVLPVPTVSGVHARIQKTEESLLVTDLDSTNGTFIDEKRLRPGISAIAPPGSKIVFGDTHLAIFRVSKLESVDATNVSETQDNPDST